MGVKFEDLKTVSTAKGDYWSFDQAVQGVFGNDAGGRRIRVPLDARLVPAALPHLDARTAESVAALLSTLARTRRAGVVVATHNEQLARSCDRTLRLEDGKALSV